MATVRTDQIGTTIEQQGHEIGERIQSAIDQAGTRLSDAGARISKTASHARELAAERVESLGEMMQKHPIATVAVGLGIGYVIGRLMSR